MIKTTEHLHDYLLNLKNKDSQDPNIDTYKKEIRESLRSYRSDQPLFNSSNVATGRYKGFSKDIVFYSFMDAPGKPDIGAHEYKRLKISWSSLRKHNTDIEVRFCYDGTDIKWKNLCDDYGVEIYPFHSARLYHLCMHHAFGSFPVNDS